MKRITYLHQYFTTPAGVGGTRSYEFARRISNAGYDVQMVASRPQNSNPSRRWEIEIVDGITVHWIAVPYSNDMKYSERIRAFARFAFHAGFRARSLSGDLLFATSTPLTIILPALFAKTRKNPPLIFEVRDLWPTLPIAIGALRGRLPIAMAKALEWLAYRTATRIVALSPGMKDGVMRVGTAEEKVTVIPNSSDVELFSVSVETGEDWRRAHPEIADRPIVLYCGTLGKINGLSYLVKLAKEMQSVDPTLAFVVVGKGAEEELVKKDATSCGVLGTNFFMYPPVSKQEVPSLFSAATITTSLFLPLLEMEANSANKFFDSLAAGRPIAINYGGWQRAILDNAEAGIYLDKYDIHRAALELSSFVNDRDRLAKSSANSRNLGREMFSRDVLARELLSVIEATLNGPQASRLPQP